MKAPIIVLAITLAALLSTALAHGQSACGEARINCSHPNISQRPSGGSGSNRGGNNNSTGRDASDYASDHTDNAYVYLNRYKESGSSSDFLAAESEFRDAIANIENYGPAEYGLCRLYSYGKYYEQATAACQIALESHRFNRQFKKWIKKNMMVWIDLNWRVQLNSKLRDELGKACALTITPPSAGSTVDPSADTMKFLAHCKEWKSDLDTEDVQLAKELAAYNAKQ